MSKRPMGHIVHQSINIYLYSYWYTIMLIKREKKKSSLVWELNVSFFFKSWIPFSQGCFAPSLVEIGPMVLEKKILKCCQHILLFIDKYNYHSEKGVTLHLNKLKSLHWRVLFAQFGWNWCSDSGEIEWMWKVHRRTDTQTICIMCMNLKKTYRYRVSIF